MQLSELRASLKKQFSHLLDMVTGTENEKFSISQTYRIDNLAVQVIVNMGYFHNCGIKHFPKREHTAEVLIEPEEDSVCAIAKEFFNVKETQIDYVGEEWEVYYFDKFSINGETIRDGKYVSELETYEKV